MPKPPDTTDAERDGRVLATVPLPIRVAVEAWRLVQPYRSLIRFAAMLALTAAGGMSMTLMMGDGLRHVGVSPSPTTTTAADPPEAGEPQTKSADFTHPSDAPAAPEADATSLAPTANGPASAGSRVVMATETAPTPATPAYPTTPYPVPMLPQVADDALPQARMSEPAVAQLRGTLRETRPR